MEKRIVYLIVVLFLLNACNWIKPLFYAPPEPLEWQTDEPGEMTWLAAMDYCEKLTLNGKKNWRLPTIDELQTIVDRTTHSPAADKTLFPNIHRGSYWSSTPYGDTAWKVRFVEGIVTAYEKSERFYVRCAQGGAKTESLFDTQPKLEWQKDDPGKMSWRNAMDYCEKLTLDGKKDWRLPNVIELQTLLDRTKRYPASDIIKFPKGRKSNYGNFWSFWSSNKLSYNVDYAWTVDFLVGTVSTDSIGSRYLYWEDFRCVREGK